MNRPSTADERKFLSRELSVFLVQFSIALHKNTSYPKGHPLLESAVEAVVLRLTTLLAERPILALGIAKNQLIIEGAATDPGNPVLRDLAVRLHRQQLGAIKFTQGVGSEEVADLLATLSTDVKRSGQPLGLLPAEELERWPHIRLFPLAFDHLELAGEQEKPKEETQGRGGQLWVGLAAAALLQQQGAELGVTVDPGELAQAINTHRRESTYDKVIIEYLSQLGRELRLGEGPDQAALQKKLTALISGLKPEVLQQIIAVGGDLVAQGQLIADLSYTMPTGAVLELMKAAAGSSQRTVSHSLLRILTKLAVHADRGAPTVRSDSDAALRETVRRLVSNWNLEDPNPEQYTQLLERLARPLAAEPESADEGGPMPSEAPRVVKMALETGVTGDAVWRATDEMVDLGLLNELLDLLDRATGVDLTVEAFWYHLATPECVRKLLMNEQSGMDAVERIIARMGLAAAEPMLDALEITDSRTTRRRLLTRLSQLGSDIGPIIVARLPGAPWFVQRNLLALLGALPEWPKGFSPQPYAQNDDPRVRREALKLMIRSSQLREEAICSALADDDEQIIRWALGAALEGCPSSAVPRVVSHLNNRNRDPELRALGIRVLGQIPTPATRNWMLERALTKRQWFRQRRLQPKSPELLAIISVLAQRWASHPAAAEALRLAAASTDPEIRNAAATAAVAS